MPLLDEGDSFRSCQLETDNGINAISSLTGNFVSEYSRARVQRANEARQQIDQKKGKQDTVDNKKDIEITISEDLAEGQVAKLEASLKLLSEGDLKLLIPSDELEDDEIHIIETTVEVPQNLTVLDLQDYQRQLMILEQQNKKRLLRTKPQSDQDHTQFEQATARELKRRSKRILLNKKQTQTIMIQQSFGDLGAAQVEPNVLAMHADIALTIPDTKRQKHKHRSQLKLGDLDDSNTINGSHLVERMPPHFDLLYKIQCKDGIGCHPVPAFRDTPIWDRKLHSTAINYDFARSHLNGTVPVLDLEAYMQNETDDVAFVVIRTVECSEGSVLMARAGGPLRWTEDIYMKSKISKIAMQQIATCYFQPIPDIPNPAFSSMRSPSNSKEPFHMNQITPAELFFFHHLHLLRDYHIKHSESKQHIDALVGYVDSRYGEEFTEAESLFARGLVSKAHILNLFRPNELVIAGTYGRPAAFVLQEWPKLNSDGWVTLSCWSFQTDGSGFARKRTYLSIPPIEPETTKIQALVAYPLRFTTTELRNLIRSCGEKQWEHRNATQITYKGWNVGRDQFFPDARFMIDHKIYRKMHEHARAFTFEKPERTHPFDRMPAYISTEQEPPDVSFLLMPPDIHGFYLNEKKWIKLFVDCIQPVSWNTKAFERLVLPPRTKDLVRALVTVRTSHRGVKQGLGIAGKRTDITSGKGNGLIMLLHGGPGTGKTLTAESVAEIAKMPLYRVTCGDIGTNVDIAEKYLNTVLHLGKTWNCVLLLDEADVFLEERSMADLKRNSLVSVFLRVLEYYDGILILTSNRVGVFDEAFKSRIQVALHYENLNRSARKKIWQNFLDMLEEDEENANFDEIKLHLDDLAGNELNGRQIRNMLTTARQLAIFRNERLDWEHLEQALSVSTDFNAYLKRVQGHSDDQMARDSGLR